MPEIPEIGSAPSLARSVSILKGAEQRRNAREGTLFLDVPSWNGELICEYRVVSREEMLTLTNRIQRLMRQANGNPDPARGDFDLIIAACIALYVIDPETGERVPVEDEQGPVGYDRIAHVMGKDDEFKSQREVISYLMGTRTDARGGWQENLLAVSIHANTIARWMSDPTRRSVDVEALLGES
jgi:hypothetical protein